AGGVGGSSIVVSSRTRNVRGSKGVSPPRAGRSTPVRAARGEPNRGGIGVAAVPGRHVWIVMVVAPPRPDRRALRRLLRVLRDRGARRVAPGVFLAVDAEGVGATLRGLADEIAAAGGQIMVADSRIVGSGAVDSRIADGGATPDGHDPR